MDFPQEQIEKKMPFLGYGLGLRHTYFDEVLELKPKLDWFEILTENYIVPGGRALQCIDKIRQDYPMVLHGVSLSIGSTDAFDVEYLNQVRTLINRIEPAWISDHLCWTGVQGLNLHDLLPIPYTRQAISHIVSRITQIQEFFGRPILMENVSSYLSYKQSEMPEWEFIVEIAKQSGCYLLLDVNNVYVSSVNHQFNPLDYIHFMPADKVVQIHLAGHSNKGAYIIDTHDAPVAQPVWDLYAATIAHLGQVSTMIERDDNMPPLADLLAEVSQAKQIAQELLPMELLREEVFA
ncbi:MAG: DUF692 domain-containing protein [Legionellales bacterium]